MEVLLSETDRVFAGSIPALYDRYLGPLLFEPYAEETARRISGLRANRLLETAAGTGAVTRALDRTLPASVQILATDLNQSMIDHGAARLTSERVKWQQADALALPFENAGFDVAVCQFGVMFFPDKVKAFGEMRRVLHPDGVFFVTVWDRIEENELANVVTEALKGMFPEDPPMFLARTPHGHHDPDKIERDLHLAGFSKVTRSTVAQRSRAGTARDPAIGYCQGTPLRNEIEARGAGRLAEATDVAAAAIAAQFGTGPIDGKIQAHFFTAAG